MATAYVLKGTTSAPPYGEPGVAIVNQLVDIPALMAQPSLLATRSLPNTPLTYFPGFNTGDSLSIPIPSIILEDMGLYCSTREDGASGDVDVNLVAANITFEIQKSGSGVAGQSAYNPLDESDNASFPVVNLLECAFDPAGPTLIQPRHTYYGDGFLQIVFTGGKLMTTAVFQIFAKGTICYQ